MLHQSKTGKSVWSDFPGISEKVRVAIFFSLWFAFVFCQPASANPVGETVRHGDVQFVRAGDSLQVFQHTDRAIIDWDSFSIGTGQVTEFLQPGPTSAALNRVTGFSVSQIDGLLKSNGRLILLNRNGILIGPNGRVDAAAFIASTLDIRDSDFLDGGDLSLSGSSPAAVINLGSISAFDGDVFLVAASVENDGRIVAPRGTAGLAAGNDVLLRESGEERVWVRGASGDGGKGGVVNRGSIKANMAELRAHHGNIYGIAVKNEGRIAATGVTRRGGQIFLSAGGKKSRIRSSGTLRAVKGSGGGGGKIEIRNSGGQTEIGGEVNVGGETGSGGDVVLLGRTIDLIPDTAILADGDSGGGHIWIGGGKRGQSPELNRAEFIHIGEGVEIDASGNLDGHGGEIVLFAERTLDFQGKISARGGASSGDGGFVELSGKETVHFSSLTDSVDVSAPNGKGGSLLFDPIDVSVVQVARGGPITGSPVSDQTTVAAADINSFLDTGGNLTIETGSGSGNGNITVEPGVHIHWASGNDLTFNASGNFVLGESANIMAEGSGSLFVDAYDSIHLQRNSSIFTQSGHIDLTAPDVTVDGEIFSNDAVFIGSPDGGEGDVSNYGEFSISEFRSVGFQVEVNADITADSLEFGGSGGDDMFKINAALKANTTDFYSYGGYDDINVTGPFALEGVTFDSIEGIEGRGDADTLIGPSSSETFTVFQPGMTELGGRTFASFEHLVGGNGDDQFIFLNQSTVDSVDGGSGVNQIIIDDGNLAGQHIYAVQEGLVSRNPQYHFANMNSVQLMLGPGDDIVLTSPTTFSQTIDGGDGFDTLITFPLTRLSGSPLNLGGTSVAYSNFEAPLDTPSSEDPTDLGFLLNTISDGSSNTTGGLFIVENFFNNTDGTAPTGIFQGGLGIFGSAAIINFGQSTIIIAGRRDDLLDAPTSLDGSFTFPPLLVITILQENLNPPANQELAQALGYIGSAILVMSDGAYAIDLTGAPPDLVAQLLEGTLSLEAARELSDGLGLVLIFPISVTDGVVAIDGQAGQAGQSVILLLQGQLDAAALQELAAALNNP